MQSRCHPHIPITDHTPAVWGYQSKISCTAQAPTKITVVRLRAPSFGSDRGFNIGTTKALFHALGKYPIFKQWFISIAKNVHVPVRVHFSTMSGIPSCPADFLLALRLNAAPITPGPDAPPDEPLEVARFDEALEDVPAAAAEAYENPALTFEDICRRDPIFCPLEALFASILRTSSMSIHAAIYASNRMRKLRKCPAFNTAVWHIAIRRCMAKTLAVETLRDRPPLKLPNVHSTS
ncbi:hypothetical protein FF38_11025 [Lucilia cuprina]|uniref:Uncharacterized protein n=1 Tax=Lucilia cuprina TaxID=7375 RepID=A0A0L0BVR2_LUCCU|nr:hypothetical protein FF38_11025 [Lucilia cuprina]